MPVTGARSAGTRAGLARLPAGQDVAGTALANLSVPDHAILRREPAVQNTVEELAVIAEVSRVRGFRRVILLSSPAHTRRIRASWDANDRGVAALIHPTLYETFDARRWWRSRHAVEAMIHEPNFKLGSLLPTFDEATRSVRSSLRRIRSCSREDGPGARRLRAS